MSCYVRHLGDLLAEAGLESTKDGRKALDRAIRAVLGLTEEHCPEVWKKVKEHREDPDFRQKVLAAVEASH